MRSYLAVLTIFYAACAGSESGATTATGGFGAVAGNAGSAGKGGAAGGDAGSVAGRSGSGGSTLDAAAGGGGKAGATSDGGGVLEGAADAPVCRPPTPDSNCDPTPLCGCNVGENCEVLDYTTGRARCVTEGSVAPYQACGPFTGPCTKGNACYRSVCKPYCENDSGCPSPNQRCVPALQDDNLTPVPGMRICSAGCDPLRPDVGCGAGLTCAFNQAQGNVSDCFVAGSGVGLNACVGGAGCRPGYQCVRTQQMTLDCLKWCRMNNPNDCQTPELCTPLEGNPMFNNVEYGVCSTMP